MTELNSEILNNVLRELFGVEPIIASFNEEMTFYYDESGNCRKFYLTDTGFNAPDSIKGNFVLAGVAHEGKTYSIDVSSLHSVFDYKKNQNELKFKHLYHNSTNFLSFIGSKRATGFLEWLNKSGLYIHYSTLNNLFYSLVDIVDSLWEKFPQCIEYFQDIKSALYDFTIEHQDELIDIFIKYTYPDVKDISAFCNELCLLIKEYNDDSNTLCGFFLELLRQMLNSVDDLDKMEFIQDNEPNMLIKEYYLLYSDRCKTFNKSFHIFDEELEVQKELSKIQLYEKDESFNNWQFVKSHESIYIQISDMIAGLLRKLFIFLDENSMEKINSIASSLNDNQINNFKIIWLLINKSDKKSQLFIKNVNTPKNVQERWLKLQILGAIKEGNTQL